MAKQKVKNDKVVNRVLYLERKSREELIDILHRYDRRWANYDSDNSLIIAEILSYEFTESELRGH